MEKKMFSTLIKNDLLKEFKKLAIDLERPTNDLLEEAMKELLAKYEKKLKDKTKRETS
jgi:hypothetical protein